MTFLGIGTEDEKQPQYVDGKWVMQGRIFIYQSSTYSTWGNILDENNWAAVSSATYTTKFGSSFTSINATGGLSTNVGLASGTRVRVTATFTPQFDAAFLVPDNLFACIALASESLVGTKTVEPESQVKQVIESGTEPWRSWTLQRELIWDGSAMHILTRNTNVGNDGVNFRTDFLQWSVEFV